jgi:dTMP kinase
MTLGKLIVFEGADGAGTTTQSKLLLDALCALSIPALQTFEPSNTPIGRFLREVLSGKHGNLGERPGQWGWRELSYLFMADRIWHVKSIVAPALAQGTHVICDRYYASTLVYHSTSAPSHNEQLDRLFSLLKEMTSQPNFLEPHLWLYMRVLDVGVLEERRSSRDSKEIYEKAEIQRKVVDLYEVWSARTVRPQHSTVRRVDATREIREVFTDCLRSTLLLVAAEKLDLVDETVEKVLEQI